MMDFTLEISLKSFEVKNDKQKSRHLLEMLAEVPDSLKSQGKRSPTNTHLQFLPRCVRIGL